MPFRLTLLPDTDLEPVLDWLGGISEEGRQDFFLRLRQALLRALRDDHSADESFYRSRRGTWVFFRSKFPFRLTLRDPLLQRGLAWTRRLTASQKSSFFSALLDAVAQASSAEIARARAYARSKRLARGANAGKSLEGVKWLASWGYAYLSNPKLAPADDRETIKRRLKERKVYPRLLAKLKIPGSKENLRTIEKRWLATALLLTDTREWKSLSLADPFGRKAGGRIFFQTYIAPKLPTVERLISANPARLSLRNAFLRTLFL